MTETVHKITWAFELVAAVLIGTMLPASVGAAAQHESVQVAGQARTYAIHIPAGPVPPNGFPVVLAFHGGGMRGEQMRKLTRLDAVADQRGFAVVYPDGVDKHWNDGRSTVRNPQDDVGFVSAIINQLGQRHPIDRGRIYATGLSNGALFVERLACELSQQIAAIAPVAGTLPSELAADCRPGRPVGILQIGGTADPIMPFDGGMVADFGGRGEGGAVLSAPQTSAHWAHMNGCGMAVVPEKMTPATLADPTRIVRLRYPQCANGGQVIQLTVLGGGHTWPGGPQYARPALIGLTSRQIDASKTLADFFLSLPARSR